MEDPTTNVIEEVDASSLPSKDANIKVSSSSKCNMNNYLNALGYIICVVTSYLGGILGWFGGKSNSELNNQYQTLVTPSAVYFQYAWGLIFISEGFFAIAQCLPKYRETPMVQKSIGCVYFLASSAQVAWTITFGYELMIVAFVSMLVLCITLLFILYRQWTVVIEEMKKVNTGIRLGDIDESEADYSLTTPPPRPSYWLLRFPFAVHAGWISICTPLMLSVLLVSLNVNESVELWTAVICLPLLFGVCMGLLLREEAGAPSYVYPLTVAYGCVGICWELYAPSQVILARHDESSISLMKNLSGFCGICLMVVVVARFSALFLRDQCMKFKKKGDDDDIVEETMDEDECDAYYVAA